MYCLKNNQTNDYIKDYMGSYLGKKTPDCILHSEDGAEFKIHKELLCQTQFMRKLLEKANCCDTLEIFFPCSKEELGQIMDFLNRGQIKCDKKINALKVLKNLNKLLGFPANLTYGLSENFTWDNESKESEQNHSFLSGNQGYI